MPSSAKRCKVLLTNSRVVLMLPVISSKVRSHGAGLWQCFCCLFPHALRVILKSPADALLDPAAAVLRRTGPVMFLVVIFAGLAIWKLAQRKESGWYMALLTGLMMVFGAFPAHYARPLVASLVPADTLAPSIFTSTYWMAGAQGVILVVLLLIPFFKDRLYDEVE